MNAADLSRQADAASRAAEEARKDGDYRHSQELTERAIALRRSARERAAGFNPWKLI